MSLDIVESKLGELMGLTPAERLALAERLVESTPAYGSPDIEQAWSQEISRRVKDVEEGRVKGIPAEGFHAELRAEFGVAPE